MKLPRNILPRWRRPIYGALLLALTLLLLPPACAPAATDQDLRQEIQDLKKEVAALKEQISRLEAGQQAIQSLLQKQAAAAPAPPPPPVQPPAFPPEAAVMPAPGIQVLTVGQLLDGKERYAGARVTVKGTVGTVLVHRKSFYLKSPEGMVEVLFDKLPDARQVQRLTSTNIEQPVTVTGVVNLPPKGAAKLLINAEAVDF